MMMMVFFFSGHTAARRHIQIHPYDNQWMCIYFAGCVRNRMFRNNHKHHEHNATASLSSTVALKGVSLCESSSTEFCLFSHSSQLIFWWRKFFVFNFILWGSSVDVQSIGLVIVLPAGVNQLSRPIERISSEYLAFGKQHSCSCEKY